MSVNRSRHGADGSTNGPNILVVRMGAMGDIIHALPAVASLKHSHPRSQLHWAIDPKWAELLEGNPFLDGVVPIERKRISHLFDARKRLRALKVDVAIDLQGLVKSAVVASLARPDRIYGFAFAQLRERPAALFYSNPVETHSPHVVDMNLELAAAAGAANILRAFPLPPGRDEFPLPPGPFVLANPLAGWPSKQWPLENYGRLASRLAQELDVALVLNGPPQSRSVLESVPGAWAHTSGIAGLIFATRAALGVVGLDSGPLHLAAALGKPGVALFGPTDPRRNGPYGDSVTVLRSPRAITSYKRRADVDPGIAETSPDAVFEALSSRLTHASRSYGTPA